MFSRRHLMLAAGGVSLAGLGGARGAFAAESAKPKPHVLEDFFKAPEVYDTALSPTGKLISIAGRITVPSTEAHAKKGATVDRAVVLIVDSANPQKVIRTIRTDGYGVQYTLWAKADRLLVWVIVGEDTLFPIRRIISVTGDGTSPVVLFENKQRSLRSVNDLGGVTDILPDHPTDILMSAWEPNRQVRALYRVDVTTGKADPVEFGSFHTAYWWTQDGVPMVRFDIGDRGLITVLARAPNEKQWKTVRKIRADQTPDFFVVGASAKPGVFLVGARLPEEDTVSVRELDLTTLAFGPPLSSRPGSDATGAVVDQYKRYLAAAYANDRVDYEFVDPTLKPHFKGIDTYFEHQCNVAITDADKSLTRFLISVTGPREPGGFYLYDRTAAQVQKLGLSRPDLDPDRLAPMETIKIKTRDGAVIDAYLTAPLSRTPGPLVVMPHGGPEVRDRIEFDLWVQVLAAQGWWVLQPNFRGSGGYGLAFAKAGWGRWGDRMQEDVEDAVAQVIAAKKLDAGRVAIMGVSYGGYAALMGGLRRPDLYKAAISVAGPTDLLEILKYEHKRDDTPQREIYEFWRTRIGDPDKDAAALRAASPSLLAQNFKIPVLLAHGDADDIVPVAQSREMAKALKAAGRTFDYVEVKDVAHPAWPDEQEKALLKRATDFLAKAFV